MINGAEKIGSIEEDTRLDTRGHPLEDMPPFDPDAAARRVREAKDNLLNEVSRKIFDDIDSDSSEEYDDFNEPDSANSLATVNAPKYERILSNLDMLQAVSKNYIEQYQPNSESRADILFRKDMLDRYVFERLSGDSADDFIKSDQFGNYSSYIVSTARQKVKIINGKKYYPELATNPVLSNPEYRRLVISKLRPADKVDRIVGKLNKNEAGYRGFLDIIEKRLEDRASVSQGELDLVGDYLYSGRDFDSGLAKKFACYMFNDARQRHDLSSSAQIGGALVNYFAHKDTLDDRLKERRIILANNKGWDRKNNKPIATRTGSSKRDYCVLSQDKVSSLSLLSDEGLSKSRPETITDLYSLMLVSFHELTHDYQKLMAADGKTTSSAMSQILNRVLRRNKSMCFPEVDKNLDNVLDENGNEIKADYYRANHDSDEMEIQADEEAWRQCRKFMHEHEVRYSRSGLDRGSEYANKHWRKCMDNEEEVRARRAFALKVDENGKEMPYIQYDIEQLGKSIGEDPEIIKQYPQLAEFFDNTGRIKPGVFFNKEVAGVDRDGLDMVTDNFGVEIATYALMDKANIENIISFIQDPNNNLDSTQVMQCIYNLRHVLSQDDKKTKPLKDINFDNYSDTKTRGKYTSVGDLRKSYLGQYLDKLYNAMHIARVLQKKYPEVGDKIEREEQEFIFYYYELSRNVDLDPEYSEKVRNRYLRTKNPALSKVAMRL